MIKKSILQLFLLLISVSAFHLSTYAQSDKIEGLWFNDIKDAKIQIYKARDGKFYGKIIWLKDPTKEGKPKLDDKNPKKDLKNQTIVGLLILKGFQKDGDNYYTDGTIYDPTNGKTYDCKMTYKGKTLSIRGYVGISLFGRTTIWERAS
ncbi:MAG TPA: DUF2147 domain-containing protein [Flavisolibacter sp.]|jgi:uncharacterized protein (DUF2147 family)|nr:DUF2147 domain-containing protein [Flavisolibacter sp.]